jgi:hypothetical protein
MNIIDIQRLETDVDGVSPGMAKYMVECASFCFSSQNHQPGVNMPVIGNDSTEDFSVYWEPDVEELLHSMNDEERTTEFGAMGVGLLLTASLTTYKFFSTARKKGGFDYWLHEEEPEDVAMVRADAILEVSGIRKALGGNKPGTRAARKKRQASKSSYLGISIYVAIIEFHRPESIFQWH